MANANIAIINITNTFDEWRIATNATANDRNQLRNSYYVKDSGDFRLANGTIRLGLPAGGTALSVEGNSNISVGNMTTTSNLNVLANATVGNLVILGNQTLVGASLLDTDLILLRANSSVDGPATIRSRRTGTGNAEVRFNNTASVWQVTSNAITGYSTILTMANVENSTFSSSLSNVATAAAVAVAYSLGSSAFTESQAAGNTVLVSQNNSTIIPKSNGVNFVNTSNVKITVTSGAFNRANIEFDITGGAAAQGAQGITGSSVQGAQGITGSSVQGAQGITGSSVQGAQGITGSSVQGAQGITGSSVQGAQGITGSGGSITDETASASTYYPLLTTSTSGTLSGVTVSSSKLSFVPSTGIVTATDFASTSDEKLKNVVQEINQAVDLIETLRGVEYYWNDSAKAIGVSEDERKQVGLIAQDVEKLYETLVTKGEDGYLRVSYDRLIPILVQAIKELSHRVKRLEN